MILFVTSGIAGSLLDQFCKVFFPFGRSDETVFEQVLCGRSLIAWRYIGELSKGCHLIRLAHDADQIWIPLQAQGDEFSERLGEPFIEYRWGVSRNQEEDL